MTAIFSNDSPDKGSGSRSSSHKAGQGKVLRKKQPKAEAGPTESGQPAERAQPLQPPAKNPNFPVPGGRRSTVVKSSKIGRASSLRVR